MGAFRIQAGQLGGCRMRIFDSSFPLIRGAHQDVFELSFVGESQSRMKSVLVEDADLIFGLVNITLVPSEDQSTLHVEIATNLHKDTYTGSAQLGCCG